MSLNLCAFQLKKKHYSFLIVLSNKIHILNEYEKKNTFTSLRPPRGRRRVLRSRNTEKSIGFLFVKVYAAN